MGEPRNEGKHRKGASAFVSPGEKKKKKECIERERTKRGKPSSKKGRTKNIAKPDYMAERKVQKRRKSRLNPR